MKRVKRTLDLKRALESGRPFTSARWRKYSASGGLIFRYEPAVDRLWLLGFNNPEGQRSSLTRYVRSEFSFRAVDVAACDYEIEVETPLMEHAWRFREGK